MYPIECTMGKLSSKLRKKEKYTDILLYQTYLFKEITIDFNHNFQTTSKSPASVSTVSLFQLVNTAIVLAFGSSLVLYTKPETKMYMCEINNLEWQQLICCILCVSVCLCLLTGCLKKQIQFYNLIIWPILVEMISNFNRMCKNL